MSTYYIEVYFTEYFLLIVLVFLVMKSGFVLVSSEGEEAGRLCLPKVQQCFRTTIRGVIEIIAYVFL